MFDVEVHRGKKLTVPEPVTALTDTGDDDATTPGDAAALAGAGPANRKAEGGSPPKVAASPAFSAYGTLKRMILGCSGCPCGCTPNQRASPATKRSEGNPLLVVEPSVTL